MRTPPILFGFLMTAALTTATPLLAQDEVRRGFIGLGIGPSAPIAGFADASATRARDGRALPGYTDSFLNLAYFRGSRFGVAAVVAYSEFDRRDAEDDDWWQVATVVAGPMYSARVNARTSLDAKLMAGFAAVTPVIDSYSTEDQTGAGLVFDVRATLRYDVFRRWAIFADAGIQSAKISYAPGTRTYYRAVISGLGVAYRPRW